MPIKPMPQLRLPRDDAVIWRYMDLWKLEAMVTELSLFFVRSDKFEDSWDSVLPPNWQSSVNVPMSLSPDGTTYTIADWYAEREIPSNPILCWNCDDTESRRMWDEYTTTKESVVVKSTVGRLKQCFANTDKDIVLGLTEYGDHNSIPPPGFAHSQWEDSSDSLPPNPWYVPRWFKRPKFNYEKELRATTHVSQGDHPYEKGFNVAIGDTGIAELIQSIRLHPDALLDYAEVVHKMLSAHLFTNISIDPSAPTKQQGS